MKSLDYIPDLIKELPSSSEDNQTFYFELKDNVRWDDGTSLTAEDVIFSAKIINYFYFVNSMIPKNNQLIVCFILYDYVSKTKK